MAEEAAAAKMKLEAEEAKKFAKSVYDKIKAQKAAMAAASQAKAMVAAWQDADNKAKEADAEAAASSTGEGAREPGAPQRVGEVGGIHRLVGKRARGHGGQDPRGGQLASQHHEGRGKRLPCGVEGG